MDLQHLPRLPDRDRFAFTPIELTEDWREPPRMVDHLKRMAMWATIPLTIAGTLIIWSYLDPLPVYDDSEIDWQHNEQLASLDWFYYGAIRLAIAVTFSACVFGVAHSVARQIHQDSDDKNRQIG